MNGITRKLRRIAFAAVAAMATLSQAEAVPIVSVSPATQNVANGGAGSVDIILTGFTQAIGGFQFDLTWTATFLSGVTFTVNPQNLMGASPLDFSFGVVGNTADAFITADGSISAPALLALQNGVGTFKLATLTFTGGPSNGLTPVNLSNVVLSDYNGFDIAGVTSSNGQICVGEAGANCAINPIPEPETYLLFAAGLAALAMRRRRAK